MSAPAATTRSFGLWTLALPLMGEFLVIALGGFAEVFFLSRIGSDAVAAYGAVAPVLLFCIVFLRLSAQGAGAVLSRYRGAGDLNRVAVAQRVALLASLALGLVLAGVLAGAGREIFSLMGVSGPALEYARQYALGWSLVVLTMSVRFPIGALAAAYGNNRWVFVSNMTGTAVAIALNVAFGPWIVGSALPALGVALAVAAGYLVNLGVLAVLARPSYVRARMEPGLIRSTAGDMARVVIPGTLDPVQFNLLLVAMTTIVAQFGSDHLAARAYGAQIGNFVFMYSMALAQASQILVSRAFGAGDVDGAKHRLTSARRRGAGGAVVLAALVAVAVWQGIGLLTDDRDVARLTVALFVVGLFLEPARSVNIMTNLSLVAVGDGRFVLAVGIGVSWLVGLPLAYLLAVGFGWGVVGVWLAMAFDECLRAGVGLWRWRTLDLAAPYAAGGRA